MMLVTAIVIPFIFLAFYFIVKKERKKQLVHWEELRHTEETEVVCGIVESIFREKKRYYQQLYVWKTVVKIRSGTGLHTIVYEKPENDNKATLDISQRDFVTCYGTWYHDAFVANRIE